MKFVSIKIILFFWVVISPIAVYTQSNAGEVATIIDSILSLKDQPEKRQTYVSSIDHLYIELYAPELFSYIKREYDAPITDLGLDIKYDLYHLMEAVYYAFSDYEKAAPIAYELLNIAAQTNNPKHYYFAYSSIAADEDGLGNDYREIEFLIQAHDYADYHPSIEAKSNIELCLAFMSINDYEKAEKYIKKGVNLALQHNSLPRLTYAFTVMADFCYQTNKSQQALYYIDKVDSIIAIETQLYDSRDIFDTSIIAGSIYTDRNNYDNAEMYLLKAFNFSKKANDLDSQGLALAKLSKLEERKGNYAKSLAYYKNATTLRDSVYSYEASKQLANLKVANELEKKNAELLIAKKNEEFSRKQTWYLLGIGITCILVLLLFLLYSRSKLKATQTASELTNERNRIHQIEIENLAHEVQLKNKELADLFLHQYEKAQLLTNIIDNIDRSNEELKDNLQEQLHKSEDWTNFKLHFDKVHEGFFQKLNTNASNLTTKDIRYCAYIRMNLTSKEIAIMLGISHRTVQGIRGRVRKKLGLTSSDDLVLYLMNL